MASLLLLDEEGGLAARWELGEGPVEVGRDETADVVVADEMLSRRHFQIVSQEGRYVLKDLNSQNGTWVDGKRAQATTLQDHVCIVAGRTLFLFSENPAAGVEPRAAHRPTASAAS